MKTGYISQTAPKCGIVRWELPPVKGMRYLEVMDPGQGNPPFRNAPVIMVWDVSNFPERPMEMRAFWWGFGNGSYEPCKSQFMYYYNNYQPDWGVFDSTGTQKGFENLFNAESQLRTFGYDLSGGKKGNALLSLKWLMGRGLIRWPASIKGIYQQLVGYELPDSKINQDLVSCLMMSAGFSKRWFYVDQEDKEETQDMAADTDRYSRDLPDRFEREAR